VQKIINIFLITHVYSIFKVVFMSKFKLNRTKQCAKCPWKVSTNPHEIPDGYTVENHKNLACTIANENSEYFPKTMHVMACHHSTPANQQYCVGWLKNQLGSGNNIALRLRMMNCENAGDLKVDGEQHERFEDTLPD
jgi:hypothetical protein